MGMNMLNTLGNIIVLGDCLTLVEPPCLYDKQKISISQFKKNSQTRVASVASKCLHVRKRALAFQARKGKAGTLLEWHYAFLMG